MFCVFLSCELQFRVVHHVTQVLSESKRSGQILFRKNDRLETTEPWWQRVQELHWSVVTAMFYSSLDNLTPVKKPNNFPTVLMKNSQTPCDIHFCSFFAFAIFRLHLNIQSGWKLQFKPLPPPSIAPPSPAAVHCLIHAVWVGASCSFHLCVRSHDVNECCSDGVAPQPLTVDLVTMVKLTCSDVLPVLAADLMVLV